MLTKTTPPASVAAPSPSPARTYGILFTFVFALAGWGLSMLPGLDRIGALACTLLLTAAYRHRFGYPSAIGIGIRFSSGTLLRAAIVLFGLKLNVVDLAQQGLPLLARGGATVAFSLVTVLAIGHWLRADRKLTVLLAIGTAICGAAAIIAVSPLLKSKQEDTAISAGLIALIGTVFATAYTVIQPWLPMDPSVYGIWSGLTLHEIAHVAMAAAPAGPDALTDGLLAKLCRVALLVPLCLGIAGYSKLKARSESKHTQSSAGRTPFPFPWFLLGFIGMSLFGSYVLPIMLPDPAPLLRDLSLVTTLLLVMAMAGLGLNIHLRDFRNRALRPFIAMLIASLLLAGFTYLSL
ncbi:YeiH family protein [Cohnella herbarum]|uniref:Putative sulfate exporter family transporter n=1 Tax=Cohnella herbarum TaxID=2728023 RepID=A0A7Z2VLW2_9BACL|nr:putative sulfate exporter family transporter [Cohnella herbarum]QJD85334.1 putative sulfate exporter family transporter [Cohnella herbarum]